MFQSTQAVARPIVLTADAAVPAAGNRLLSRLYIGVIALLLVVAAQVNVSDKGPWMIGDWAINYQGGFVRRGLPGEVLRLLSHDTHVPLSSLIVLTQLLVYGLLLAAVWRLVLRASGAPWIMAFLVSPATLAFPVLDFVGGFRKDILLLAGLAWLILLLISGWRSDKAVALYCMVAAAVLVLSHEAVLRFLPYWFAAVAIIVQDLRRAATLMLPAAIVGVGCWLAVVTHPGNARVAAQVCTSLNVTTQDLCGGAVASLAQTREAAHGQMERMVAARHPIWRYIGLAALALLPGIWALAQMHADTRSRWCAGSIAACAAVSLACSSVLFWYSLDWGRWVYMHAFSLFLVLLLADLTPSAKRPLASTPWWWYPCLLVYATLWSLPHLPGTLPPNGYVGIVHTLLSPRA